MELGLTGAAVLVTGGSRGIGREIAMTFAREGADVAICGRRQVDLDRTRSDIENLGTRAFTFRADLTEDGACASVVNRAASGLGRLDVLVNNASNDVLTQDEVVDPVLERVMGKTMVAVRSSTAAVPHLVAAGGGSIVMIGGSSARQPFSAREMGSKRATTASGVSNAALTNFAKHLAVEVMSDGVRVNVVHPHFTRTERYNIRLEYAAQREGLDLEAAAAFLSAGVPAGRLPDPTDIAPLVLFLSCPLASMITGQAIAVDGGAVKAVHY